LVSCKYGLIAADNSKANLVV